MTVSNRFPVSSFGAELQATLREGANKELRIRFNTEALATRFMHRLNALRAAMKREKHADWEQLYRCGIHKDPADPRIIVLNPRDAEFRQAVRDAGVSIVAPLPDTSEYEVKATGPNEPVDDFLATLRDATTVPKK
jgi:hypothetical protein